MIDDTTNEKRPTPTASNSRPGADSIAQTEGGLPDDSASAVAITPEEEAAIEEKIRQL